MRTRKEVEGDANWPDAGVGRFTYLSLEVLLDIRDLLLKADEETARCGHGATGLCMACVARDDLLRPHA